MVLATEAVGFIPASFSGAILNYVAVRSLSPPKFLPLCSRLGSVSNSPHAGLLRIPLAPQIFITASHSVLPLVYEQCCVMLGVKL